MASMTLDEYQEVAMSTFNKEIEDGIEMLNAACLGIAGESGEVCDHLKKYMFQGHDLDEDKVARELGDVLYYIAIGAKSIGKGLGEIAQMNKDKLSARFPEGFDPDKSINREEG